MKQCLYRVLVVLFLGTMLGLEGGSVLGNALNRRISFKHLSLQDGLSASTVFHILQDQNGYMWFATGNGLNRYDGYKFTVFQNDRKNGNSLLNNATRRLYVDRKGLLWIATNDGLSCYDMDRERWQNYPCRRGAENVWVHDILELPEGGYLVGTSRGLFRLNDKYQPIGSSVIGSVNCLLRIDDGYLLGTSTGLYRFDLEGEECRLVDASFKGVSVNALLPNEYNGDRLWIGTEYQGLFLYDLKTKELKGYRHRKEDDTGLSSNTVRSLCYDNQHRLWVGTFVGLNILSELDGQIQKYFNRAYLESEISQNSIRSLFCDSQGGMWCGTYFGGLNYYHPQKSQFEHFVFRPGERSLNDNVMSAILEDRKGRIWLGTNDNGVNLYMPETGQFVYYRHREGDLRSISGNNIKTLCQSPNNDDLWLGIHDGGLCRYRGATGGFERIHFAENHFADDRVYSLLFTDEQTLWVGTLAGLYRYNISTGKAEELETRSGQKLFSNKQILALYKDREEGIWIGTQDGFYRYSMATGELDLNVRKAQPFEIHGQVYGFNQDQNGRVWIGTSGGLFAYDARGRVYIDLSTFGFPTVSVFGILEDSFRRLWISTSDGLFVFDLNSNKWRRYNTSDGIQSNQFTPYSYCKTRGGRFYFGGINGVNSFSPEQLKDNPFAPQPIIDNLTVFNKTVVPGDETGILDEGRVSTQKEIRIPPRYTLWGIEFVVPNYLAGKNNNQFAYQLEGFDKEWYYTNKTEVSYSNLTPGTYTFRVKAANNSGKWCDRPTELTIVVMPRWYQTWLARVLFVLLIGGGIYAAMRFNLNRKLITRELELERLDKERMRRMEQEKIRFFINVSHEFRTPLALILSPVQEALRKGVADKWLSKQLVFVQRNALRMLHLVNQVLDYRRAEMGAIELKVTAVRLEPLARSIYDMFVDLALGKKIHYEFEWHLHSESFWLDPGYLERILLNLISNAIKFTPEQGRIVVSASEEEGRVVLRVSDTGCGIPAEKQSKVFDRFYQVEENAQGTGVGLSFVRNLVERHHGEITLESEVGQGATFAVSLPSTKEAYAEDELAKEMSEDPSLRVFENYKNDLTLLEPEDPTEVVYDLDRASEVEQRYRLLIVEDDRDIRNYLTQNLSPNYEIFGADNGEEGWQKVQEIKDIDLILSDVMMPVMDGIAFCKKVKRNIHFCHIPVILLTAKSEVEDQLQGLQTGADDYISKPFVLAILQSKIANVFRQKQRIIRHYMSNIEINPVEITTNTLDEEMLDKARKIVIRCMKNPDFSVEELSREMGMSRSNLHLKMKAVTGESAIEFIRRIRLAEACRLLKEGRFNIAEISTYIGFTPSYFSTAFKKYIGCLPTEYNEKSKNLTNEK